MKTLLAAIAFVALVSPALAGNTIIRNHATAVSGSSSSASNRNSNTSNSASNSSSNNAGNSQSTSYKDRLQPGSIGLPGLASDICHGSFSLGGGFPGGSVGLGFTTGDGNCRNAYLAQVLQGMGYKRQAVQLLRNEIPEINKAFGGNEVYGPVRSSPNGHQPKACNAWQGGVVGSYCIR